MLDARKRILEFLEGKQGVSGPKIAAHLGVSRQRAHILLTELMRLGSIVRVGKRRGAQYILPHAEVGVRDRYAITVQNQNLKEHEMLIAIKEKFIPLKLAPENVQSIFDFAFSEMLNNAIEHSGSTKIDISVLVSGNTLSNEPALFVFTIRDYGIGAFKNIEQKRGLASELEAMQDVLKGKVTTAPEAHSGQGIFFTSKMADRFSIRSFDWELRVDNTLPDIFFVRDPEPHQGTEVRFEITFRSARHIIDVFRAFEAQDGTYNFDRTEIQVRLFTFGTVHVSRSQARRVLIGLEKFKRITLDFERVPNVGQAFADEIFRVFRMRYPTIRIDVKNANESVQFMIDRVDFDPPTQGALAI